MQITTRSPGQAFGIEMGPGQVLPLRKDISMLAQLEVRSRTFRAGRAGVLRFSPCRYGGSIRAGPVHEEWQAVKMTNKQHGEKGDPWPGDKASQSPSQ
jgi:hypothetical protein